VEALMKRMIAIACLAAMTLIPGNLFGATYRHRRHHRRHYVTSRRYVPRQRHATRKSVERIGGGAAGGAIVGGLLGGGKGAAIGAAAGGAGGYAYDRHKKHEGK
jgi:uncharacterized protein YcfJ